MTTISLLTDFGLRDGNVGVMKAVIWGIAPDANIADLAHSIPAQNIRDASFTLLRSAFYFPPGSVHILVVDPGVGTKRKPIALQIGQQYFVGPDNGVFTDVLEHGRREDLPSRIVHTNKPAYWRSEISSVFHGRDIFAPVGAHLATGIGLENLGDPIDDPVLLTLPKPEQTPAGWRAEVAHIDHFGNIYTNLRREHVGDNQQTSVSLGDTKVKGLVQAFGEREDGEMVALYSSTDYLMLAEVNGDAGAHLKAKVGDTVLVEVNNG